MFPTYEEFRKAKLDCDKAKLATNSKLESGYVDYAKKWIIVGLRNGDDYILLWDTPPAGRDWINWLRSECLQQGLWIDVQAGMSPVGISIKYVSEMNWFEKLIHGVRQ